MLPFTSAAIKGWLASAGVTSRNAIVLGTTGLRPAFGLFTNVMYDLPSHTNLARVVVDEATIANDGKPLLMFADTPKVASAHS